MPGGTDERPTDAPAGASADPVAAWGVLLDRLEADVARARTGRPLSPWETPAPAAMPPLPPSLLPRARALRAAHAALASEVGAARAELGRRLAAARRLPRVEAARRPVYLDALG